MLQRWDQVPKDFETVFVRPVVKHPAEKVGICAFHGLFGHEVMCHKCHAVGQVLWHLGGSSRDHCREILHDELKGGKFGGEVDTDISERSADLMLSISKMIKTRNSRLIVELASTTIPFSRDAQG